jgi:hypothetical protein
MIKLDDSKLIGKGSERWCYQHPQDPSLCIKVSVHPPKPGRKPQSEREAAYFRQLRKRNVPFTHIPEYHGTVMTNLNTGYLFDRVADADGRFSDRLEDVHSQLPKQLLQNLLIELRGHMLHYGIIPCDLSFKNILLQKGQESTRLVLVDGIGNRDFIPLASYYLPFARIKIARIWRKFLKKIQLDLPE